MKLKNIKRNLRIWEGKLWNVADLILPGKKRKLEGKREIWEHKLISNSCCRKKGVGSGENIHVDVEGEILKKSILKENIFTSI